MFLQKIRKSLRPGYLSFIYDVSYFDIFKLPLRYDIDKNLLNKNYENIKSMPFSKDAYTVLNNDLKRASYILKIKGVKVEHINDDDFLKNIKYNQYLLPALKEEINEELENVKNEFAICIDYDEILSAKKHYDILYRLTRIDKEIYDRINE